MIILTTVTATNEARVRGEMADIKDISIVDIKVESGAPGNIFADIIFVLEPRPDSVWHGIFKHMYMRHRWLGNPMKQNRDTIVQKWPKDSIGKEITEKFYKDVADTNVAYREQREKQASDQAALDERKRIAAEKKRQTEAELKRKLLGNDKL